VKIGRGVHFVYYKGADHRAIVVHNSKRRVPILFAAGVDVARMRKSAEIILKKVRLFRENDRRFS
jgi:hypothetical protein